MTTTALSLLAILMPSPELLIIIAVGASLPLTFFLWIRGWLGAEKDENPEQVIEAQAKADKEHQLHHGSGHGHDHGHGGKGGHHAHA